MEVARRGRDHDPDALGVKRVNATLRLFGGDNAQVRHGGQTGNVLSHVEHVQVAVKVRRPEVPDQEPARRGFPTQHRDRAGAQQMFRTKASYRVKHVARQHTGAITWSPRLLASRARVAAPPPRPARR